MALAEQRGGSEGGPAAANKALPTHLARDGQAASQHGRSTVRLSQGGQRSEAAMVANAPTAMVVRSSEVIGSGFRDQVLRLCTWFSEANRLSVAP